MLVTLFTKKKFIYLGKLLLIFLLAFLCQFLLMPHLAMWGVVPNLLLVAIVLVAVYSGLEVAIPFTLAVCLLFSGIIGKQQVLVGWYVLPLLGNMALPKLVLPKRLLLVLHVVICSFLFELINLASLSIFHGLELVLQNYLIVFLNPLLNGLLAVVVAPIFQANFQEDNVFSKYY